MKPRVKQIYLSVESLCSLPTGYVYMLVAYIRSSTLTDYKVQDLFKFRGGQPRVDTVTQLGPSLTSRSSCSMSGGTRTPWHPEAQALEHPPRIWLRTWVRIGKTRLLPRPLQR